MVGKARPDRGILRSPDGVDPRIRRTRKTQRDSHNSGVKIWSLCSVSSTLSHANLEQPFQTLAIKWEVNMLLKKSSCVFLPASLFMRLSLSLCRCELFYIYMCTYVDVNLHVWLYNSSSYWKGSLRVTLDKGRQLYLLLLNRTKRSWEIFIFSNWLVHDQPWPELLISYWKVYESSETLFWETTFTLLIG